jgi:hypothetical protein
MPNALARKYGLQVSTDNTNWVNVKGIDDFNAPENPTIQGADTYDTNGFNSFEKTMTGWGPTIKFLRPINAGVYDAGQELIRACRFQFGTAARIYVRWFDKNGSTDAYSGLALVSWTPSKTGTADVEEVTVAFQGDGILTQITNPYQTTLLPVILSITPTGKGAGGAVLITGANFTGLVATTGVKFAAVNATTFDLQNDQVITAVLPAGSAGLITVLVTTSVGASTATNNYTRTT